ncbi:ABC transporter substrate-binding protein [Microbacterium sp. zg-Y818]|uniref:ABC transporter substrate-binding protein n=1 Tax=unclassified Microbacterium TaxID=2609290 RepID=UPI00214B2AF7|nr:MULTISPECIES: ABC transporter substrate-binding protein [unclassified Microbacterium]MCR2801289.1 ABC transporter substrate-binding protein [Microbacterium sp. zg.Y818]WIM21121.1 ABC transporter substrate-binding protein [Microbacterium sp. zg-Y818]
MRFTRKTGAFVALIATTALVTSGCSAGGGEDGGDSPDALTIATWVDIPETLLEQFTEETGIAVEINSFADGASAQTVLRNGLGSNGAGLSDVHLVELDWWTEMMAVPEDWVTLPAVEDRWVDWKVSQGSVGDEIKGYGMDIGPLAIAYDSTLMQAAGLPADPAGFTEFIGGEDATWESFLDAGRQFTGVSDAAWIDSTSTAFQAAINQLPSAFEDPDSGDAMPLADNTDIEDLFTLFGQAAEDGVSAGVGIGHADWDAGFQARRWATVITPAWATGIIAENAAGLEGWQIAEIFPDGGGNWGGSFFAVPATGDNTEAATELADFLTSPDAAVEMFLLNGQFPSQLDAMADPTVSETPNEFFGDQPTGGIYAALAESAGDKAAGGYRGVNFAGIQTLVMDGIRRIETGNEDTSAAWKSTVSEFDALGLTD